MNKGNLMNHRSSPLQGDKTSSANARASLTARDTDTSGRETGRKLDLTGRTVLVVGGAGYVGSVMASELLRYGASVRVLDDLLYGNGFALRHLHDRPGFSFVRGDFTDPGVLRRTLAGIDSVIQLAALVGDPVCKRYSDLAVKVNLEGSKTLFNMARDQNVQRFVFASTCSNYGIHQGSEPATETAELNPQSLYAETKIDMERYLVERSQEGSTCPSILRIATAYGLSPRMRFDLTIAHFTRALADGEELTVYDADTWRPYCHVRDISKAFATVLCQEPQMVRGEIYNVGDNEQQLTKRMIVDLISEHLQPIRVKYLTGDTDPRDYRVCFDKISRSLGFRCEHTVQSYLPRLLQAYREGAAFGPAEVEKAGNYRIREGTADLEPTAA